MELISVIVNTFNSASTLKRAIDSILNQTWQNIEVIIYDNNSADSTYEVFEGYTDPRIKYFKANKTYKLGKARRLAISQSSGKYVAFCDADDWWHPEKCRRQMHDFQKSNYTLCASDFIVSDEINSTFDQKYKGRKSTVVKFSDLSFSYNLGLLTILTKKDLLLKCLDGLDDLHFVWDRHLVLLLLQLGDGYYKSEVLAYNSVSPNSLSVAKRFEVKREFCDWVERQSQFGGSFPLLRFYCDTKFGYSYFKYLRRRIDYLVIRCFWRARFYLGSLVSKVMSRFDSFQYKSFVTNLILNENSVLPIPSDIICGYISDKSERFYEEILFFLEFSDIFNRSELENYSNWKIFYAMDEKLSPIHATIVHLDVNDSPYTKTIFFKKKSTSGAYLSVGYTIPSFRKYPISLVVLNYILADLKGLGISRAFNIVHSSTPNVVKYFNAIGFDEL